jgi:hypothetical protein
MPVRTNRTYRRLALALSTAAVAVGALAIPASASASTLYTKDGTAVDVPLVWVGNTDGEGVYVRNTPALGDRLTAYPDNTVLVTTGPDVVGDGHTWHQVRTPDGVDGYVPVEYTVTAPASPAKTASVVPAVTVPSVTPPTAATPAVTLPAQPQPAPVPSAPAPTSADGAAPAASGYGQISKTTGLPRTTYVSGYTRKDGTHVAPYYRSHR